eukprot:1323695-Rhodomonas_salina.2
MAIQAQSSRVLVVQERFTKWAHTCEHQDELPASAAEGSCCELYTAPLGSHCRPLVLRVLAMRGADLCGAADRCDDDTVCLYKVSEGARGCGDDGCVCVRERVRAREREHDRDSGKDRGSEREKRERREKYSGKDGFHAMRSETERTRRDKTSRGPDADSGGEQVGRLKVSERARYLAVRAGGSLSKNARAPSLQTPISNPHFSQMLLEAHAYRTRAHPRISRQPACSWHAIA